LDRARGRPPFRSPSPPPPQSIDVDFGLADQVFTAATIPTKDPSVCLWLGAGVSVEYPLDEAATLLSANAANAAANLEANARDLAFVKDCVTTTQVGGGGGGGREGARAPPPSSPGLRPGAHLSSSHWQVSIARVYNFDLTASKKGGA
jgi:hypothetical protein